MDFFYFQSENFLLLEDGFSKWLELWCMPQGTSAEEVIQKLRLCFATFGIPREFVTDNGSPFNSTEFSALFTNNHMVLTCIAPYRPQSDGQAERSVQTDKRNVPSRNIS